MNDLKREYFDRLCLDEKGRIVFQEIGRFLTSREYYNQKFILYDLGKFYAEVLYHPNSNEIREIKSLSLQDKVIDLYINASTKRDTAK